MTSTTPTEPEALAACPFCDGDAVMRRDDDPGYPWHVTFEHDAECMMYALPTDLFRSFSTEAEAATAWNRRPNDMLSTPATRMLAGEADEYGTLIAAGFDDYAAICALRTEPDGRFANAYFYSDGQWRFQTGGHDLSLADGKFVRCVLTKPLYATPPAAEPVGLREAVELALACTPQVRDGEIIYDCGDPWEILRAALATPARTDDAGVDGVSVQIIGGPCAHRWSAMTMTGHMSCVDCRQTRPMTVTEVVQWTK